MLLEEPLALGTRTLRSRIVAAPMERNYCDTDGSLTDLYIEYLRRRAAGGAALVYTEATYVAQEGKSRPRQAGLINDEHESWLRKLATAIHSEGTLVGVELNHGGRTSPSRVSGQWPVAPSPVPLASPGAETPTELSIEQIERIVGQFGDAAKRAERAGVDVLSIHAAHGYLIQSFMSPATNHRTDRYAEPTLFLREVIDSVRRSAPELPIGLRLSAFEGNSGGLTADQQLKIVRDLGEVCFDFLDISAGNYEAPEWSVQPAEFSRGVLAAYAERYREFAVPVGVAGRICDENTAERILESEQADFISMARALHADPDFPRRVLSQQLYRPCIACNLCADDLGTGQPIRCSVNAEVGTVGGEDPTLIESPSEEILVIGAGPAGLEASSVLAEAGHSVHLVDSNDAIGGQFRLPTRLAGVPEYRRLLDWYQTRLEESNVKISLGQRATPDFVLSSGARSVVLATGSHGRPAEFKGAEDPRIQDIRAWLDLELDSPRQVTIIGGDREAVAVGYDLAVKGSQVTIVMQEEELGPDMGRRAKILAQPYLERSPRVKIYRNTRVVEYDGVRLHLESNGSTTSIEPQGPILTTLGAMLTEDLLHDLPSEKFVHAQAHGPLETVVDALRAGREAARRVTQRIGTAASDVTAEDKSA